MKRSFSLVAVVFSGMFLSAVTAKAEDLQQASQLMCEKARQCAMEQMRASASDMPPQMKAMMEQAINGMCANIQAKFPQYADHPLAAPAAACMRSMANLSCEELTDMEDVPTEACKTYREKAKQYGVE